MRSIHHLKSCAGVSLAEIMVGVAITGIVSVFAMNQLSDFTKRQWESETKASSVAETELAAQIIGKTLPLFVASVNGSDGLTNASPWGCFRSGTSCTMTINYSYSDIDGNPLSTPVTPMEVNCEVIQDARLTNETVALRKKASIMTSSSPETFDSSCLTCPAGKAPQLKLRTYEFNSTTGAPTESLPIFFPKKVGELSKQGSLSMGVCFKTSPYQENMGPSVTQPWNVDKYDRWNVTLRPVYSRVSVTAGMQASSIEKSLQANSTSIVISVPKRFAPGMRVTPVK